MPSFKSVAAAMTMALLSLTQAMPFNETLFERDTPGSTCYTQESYSEQIGDGDPHTDALCYQVSEALSCTGGTCNEAYSTSQTVGWSFEAGFDVAPEWTGGSAGASLGFSIEESVTTGTTATCDGEEDGVVCVYAYIKHAAYTVDHVVKDSCGGDAVSDPFVMRSPTDPDYYCVRDAAGCSGGIGNSYWINSVASDSIAPP